MTVPTTGSQLEPARLTESYLSADTGVSLSDLTVGGLLAARAAEHPDRLALVGVRHNTGETDRLTYARLYEEACRVATGLSRMARPGDMVALWAPNVVEWPIIEYGAALAGVTLVALNPVLRQSELEYALSHSGSTVLLHASQSRDYHLADVVEQIRASFPELVTIDLKQTDIWCPADVDPEVIASAPTDPDSPVMLQYTSGTTGRPKGVLLRHRSLVNNAHLTMRAVEAREGAVCVNPLPMFHTAACVIGTLGPCWIGGTEILVDRFVPGPVLDTLREERATVLFYVPAVLGALLEAQAASTEAAPQLDVVMGGASNVPATMIEAAETTFGATVINLFGQTELAPVLSTTRPGDTRRDQLETVGHPLPQVDCKVVDPATGAVLPLGTSGEICARGPQQLICYLHDEEATLATIDAEGFVHTGDLGSMDERGYLTVTGRLKELIIRGGENISPAVVETALVAHPEVAEAVVVGLPDDRWGEVVAALVRTKGDPAVDLRERLEAFAREHLAPYQVPARWFLSGDLPVTPTGKVRKFKAVEQVLSGAFREL